MYLSLRKPKEWLNLPAFRFFKNKNFEDRLEDGTDYRDSATIRDLENYQRFVSF